MKGMKKQKREKRNSDKPIRMDWTVCKITEKGRKNGNFVYNHVVKVGRKTDQEKENEKNYDIVEQLLCDRYDCWRFVVVDNGFPTLRLPGDKRWLSRTKTTATHQDRTAYFPKSHTKNVRTAKCFDQGFSKTFHHKAFNIKCWNNINNANFLNNVVH